MKINVSARMFMVAIKYFPYQVYGSETVKTRMCKRRMPHVEAIKWEKRVSSIANIAQFNVRTSSMKYVALEINRANKAWIYEQGWMLKGMKSMKNTEK